MKINNSAIGLLNPMTTDILIGHYSLVKPFFIFGMMLLRTLLNLKSLTPPLEKNSLLPLFSMPAESHSLTMS